MKILSLRFSIFSFLFLVAVSAKAETDFAGILGIRMNSANTDVTGATVTAQSGVMAGVLAWFPVHDRFGLRSGAVFNQRFIRLSPTVQGTVDILYSYWDLPLTATFQFSSGFFLYGGPVLAFNQSKEVKCSLLSTCGALDVKSVVVPWQVGLDFRMIPQLGGEFFVEMIPGELSRNVSDMKSLGLSLVYYFN